MKIISFSCVEKLDKLLSKECCQTIRPLFEKKPLDAIIKGIGRTVKTGSPYKQPKFRVGEKVQLMWKQRSKSQVFCQLCGRDYPNECKCIVDIDHAPVFSKLLGIGETTEVFQIEMLKLNHNVFKIDDLTKDRDRTEELNFLWESDGFKDVDMFWKWFEKYDLSQPRKFATYRWKWL